MTRNVLASMLVLVACGDDPGGVAVMMPMSSTAPAYGTVPFPTDAVREGDRLGAIPGLEGMARTHRDLALSHIAALDGFGVRPLVEFFLDGDLALDAIPEGAAGVVDVDPDSPERGRVIPMEWRYQPTRRVIAGVPATGVPLREGTRYAAYVTTAVGATRMPSFGDVPARWQTTADAVAAIERDDLAGITVFTTQHASQPLLDALGAQQAAAAPTLSFARPEIIFAGTAALDRTFGQAARATEGPRVGLERWGFDNPSGMAHDHVGVVGTGMMTVVRFRGDETGTDGPEDETFSVPPTPRGLEEIPITFILPATPPPATGYPVVIYGHGLGQSRELALTFAEPLTSRGFAVVAIDMVGHGSRFDPTDVVANMSRKSQFTGVADAPDGFPDNKGLTATLDFFENFLNVSAIRDGLRQSALDLCRVSQLLRQPDLDLSALAGPGGVPVLDPSRLSYMADSFGTVVGTVFAAIEPDIDLYVFDVPGGGILDQILVESPEISAITVSLITSLYNPPRTFGSIAGIRS